MLLKEHSDQRCQLLLLFLGHRRIGHTPGMKRRAVYSEEPADLSDRRDAFSSKHVDHRVHVGYSLRPK